MRNTILLSALLLFSVPLAADEKPLVAEGVALYDAGKYDEAVAKFKAALAEDPSDDVAAYELGLTYQAKNDVTACIALIEPRVAKKGPRQALMLSILGNCYDIGGDAKKAIATYRRGLKIDADDDQLLYNLAVTLIQRGELDEARALLEKELTIRPYHASGRYALAGVFASQNFRVPAVIEYLRFLALEPSGVRAKEGATRLATLLGTGVAVKDHKNITISVDPNARKEEGDYASVELMLAMAGAAGEMGDAPASAFEKKRSQIATTLAMLTEAPAQAGDYTATQNVPFFARLAKEKLLDVFAGVAIYSLGLEGTDAWEKANEAELNAFVAFMRSGGQ